MDSYAFRYFSYLKLFALLFLAIPFFLTNKKDQQDLIIYFSSCLLVLAGYTIFLIEERYLIGCQLLLFIAVFFSFHCFFQQKIKPGHKTNTLYLAGLLLISLSFAKTIPILYNSWNNQHQVALRTIKLEEEIVGLPFLKNKKFANSHYRKGMGLDYICLKTGSIGYGSPDISKPVHMQYLDLKKHAIDYYFYQEYDGHTLPQFLSDKKPVYTSSAGDIKIYYLKPYTP